jgi:hypothetical protein
MPLPTTHAVERLPQPARLSLDGPPQEAKPDRPVEGLRVSRTGIPRSAGRSCGKGVGRARQTPMRSCCRTPAMSPGHGA